MKKIITICLSLFLLNASFAQEKHDTKSLKEETKSDKPKRVVYKGMNSVNVYYGISLFSSVYKAVAGASATDISVKTTGPVGLVYEHLVSNVVGIGVELGYTNIKVSYNEASYSSQIYSYTYNFKTIRAMVRANFHFAKTENFDAYGFVSVGYRSTTYSYSTTDPAGTSTGSFKGLIPFGIKPGIGLRYFFTKNIGINAEFAIGTPVMGGGLSFKF